MDQANRPGVSFVKGWLLPLGIALVVVVLVRAFIFTMATVEGSSMMDTLNEGERLAVTKIDLLFSPLRRGDVVVSHYPGDERLFVKRVVALGGDTVAIEGGRLMVNGAAVDEPYITRPATSDFPAAVVPEGCVFLMGDNRPRSTDSREVGPVSAGDVVGRVRAVVWPLGSLRGVEGGG